MANEDVPFRRVIITDIVGGTVTLSGTVAVDTWGALNDAAENNPDAASATMTSLMRGVLEAFAGEYETVAASQTAQVMGATGGTGDTLKGLLVVPASVSPGNVIILDGATSITVFAGGTNSVTELRPFWIPLGMKSVSGAWKVTTGANVSVIAVGNFT